MGLHVEDFEIADADDARPLDDANARDRRAARERLTC